MQCCCDGSWGIDPLPSIRLNPCLCEDRLGIESLAVVERYRNELERQRLGANGQDDVKNLRISIGISGGLSGLKKQTGSGAVADEMLQPVFSRPSERGWIGAHCCSDYC